MSSYRTGAAVTALSPVLLLVAVTYHPHINDLRDKEAVATALVADTTRWGVAHLVVGLAAASLLLAFLSVDAFLRESARSRLSAVGVPLIVVGSVLFAFLPAMEIAMLGVHRAGADVDAAMREMDTWFQPILLAGAAAFAVGVACFAVAIVKSGVLGRNLTGVVVGSLGIAAAARFVPLGTALYVGAVALVVALTPVAGVMHRHSAADSGNPRVSRT